MSLFDRAVVAALPAIPRPLVRRLSEPYIAGVGVEEAIAKVRDLNGRGMMATLDILGEHIARPEEALGPRDAYLKVLDDIVRSRIDANVSIKLTQLGLKVDAEGCYSHIRAIVARAESLGIFVRIDMEDSACTDSTLDIYRRLRAEGLRSTGVVLQAMLRRTLDDAAALGREQANVRLCKGIYVEPHGVAFSGREEVRASYLACLERLLEGGSYVAIATHDEVLTASAEGVLRHTGLPRERYEFQMLLGVREVLRQSLVEKRHRLRVYVPFGEHWYAYSIRRMRENPRVAGLVARAVLGKIGGGNA